MADKKATIVIKKITVVSGGAHGGAWKVAFADFMTAMMCFFLVMWLLSTASESSKKAVSDYFSTPSVIEYYFQNFGVELTLEKLFLDVVNEPLKTLQDFITPADKVPNILNLGLKKVVMAYMAEELGDLASDVSVTSDSVTFEIPDMYLFKNGTANPAGQFAPVMDKVGTIVGGLEDSDVIITSEIFHESVLGHDHQLAKAVAGERLDIVYKRVQSAITGETVDSFGRIVAKNDDRKANQDHAGGGFIRFEIKQKKTTKDGKKPRPIKDEVFGAADADASVYENFVKQVSERNKKH